MLLTEKLAQRVIALDGLLALTESHQLKHRRGSRLHCGLKFKTTLFFATLRHKRSRSGLYNNSKIHVLNETTQNI